MLFARRSVLCISVLVVLSLLLSGRVRCQDVPRPGVEEFGGRKVAAGEVLIKFRSGVVSTLSDTQRSLDAETSRIGGVQQLYRIRSRSKTTAELIRAVSSRTDVEYAEPNYIVHSLVAPADPLFSLLWAMHNSSSPGADISALAAWNMTTGSRNSVIGIVDTGVDYTHPDLASNMWSAPSQFTVIIGGASVTCAAGTHGFNAITRTCDPMDDDRHGTHVAGTIGAAANNSIGVVGVNWVASMMGLKFIGSDGTGTVSDAIDAIEFAIQVKQIFAGTAAANVRILSNSWGGSGYSQAMLDEISKAATSDMLFVAAAGNESSNIDKNPTYPASYTAPSLISVAATDSSDSLASFSNFGRSSVHLGAPGVGIYSTLPNGAYGSLDGTSMATPHVSGAAALLLSACNLDTPGLKAALLDSIDLLQSLSGVTVTGGRLNLNKALHGCSDAVTVSPQSITFPDQVELTTGTPLQVSLINHQLLPLTISSTSISGPYVSLGGSCGTTLAPGASCTMLLSFSPTSPGYQAGTLIVADNSLTSPHVVALGGTGIVPVSVSPASLVFAPQVVGTTSEPNSITILNNLARTLSITSVGVTAGFSQTNTCIPAGATTGSLGAHNTCTVKVVFNPATVGSIPGTLTVSHDALGSPEAVQLSGTAVNSAAGQFVVISSMNVPREGHTATLLDNASVLIFGGTLTPAQSELYNPVTKTFSLMGDVPYSRRHHTATLLPNGKVLMAGGNDHAQYLSSTVLYDSSTGRFNSGPNMSAQRTAHTATLLLNGKVLITGGCQGNLSLNSAEVYDPASNTFTATGSMVFPRCMQTATLLSNGNVLVTGGTCYPALDNNCSLSAEIYNPATGQFARVGNMNPIFGRFQYHTGTLLNNGKVLLTGGVLANPAPGDLYDPLTKVFTPVGSMPDGDGGYQRRATLLDDGRVLFTPGVPPSWDPACMTTCAQIYDPTTATFITGTDMGSWHDDATATRLADGKVLITGGDSNYMGDGSFEATARLYQQPSPTSSSLTTSARDVGVGHSVTFTTKVSFDPLNSIAGPVYFFDGTTMLGSVALDPSGTVSYTTAVLPAGEHMITATYIGDAINAASTSSPVVLNITSNTIPYVTWSNPSPIVYGAPLSAVQLNATAEIPGSFTFEPAAGTVLAAGTHTLNATFTPTDTTSYEPIQISVTLIVRQASLIVMADNVRGTYGASLPTLSATYSGFVDGDTAVSALTGSPKLSTTATAGSPVGFYPISIETGTLSAANYEFTLIGGTLEITKAATITNLASSNGSALSGASITLTAKVASSSTGTPTGTVTFMNGSNLIASGTLDIAGTTTLSTSALPSGLNQLIAIYNGDSNFNASTSLVFAQTIQDFNLPDTPPTLSIKAGQSGIQSITIAPMYGFAGAVTLTCAVPPAMIAASCSATPVQISGPSSANSVVTVTTSAQQHASLHTIRIMGVGGAFAFLVGLLLVPRSRKQNIVCFILVLSAILLLLVSVACGGGGATSGGSGPGNPQSGTPLGAYSLTLTATSGTASHSMILSVVVQ